MTIINATARAALEAAIDASTHCRTPPVESGVPGRCVNSPGRGDHLAGGALVAKRMCSIVGCERPFRRRDRCDMHYQRAKAAGAIQPLPRLSDEDRFWSHVDKGGPDDCWLWTGAQNGRGYGVFSVGGRNGSRPGAHRWLYMRLVDPSLNPALALDHLCHTRDATCPGGVSCPHRACVNPTHLEPVTHQENMRRGSWARRTHCPKGHPYSEENTFVRANGSRACRICGRASAKRWRDAQS